MKKCVFAGSFDPITLGHMHVIERCAMMFEEVVVALGVNAQKKCKFSMDDRFEMLKLACARLRNVTVKNFEGFLADFMKEENAEILVRGVRNKQDIEYEEKCFKVTSALNPDVKMMFFQAPKTLERLSSTFVKDLLKDGKSVKKYVPEEILPLLEKKCK